MADNQDRVLRMGTEPIGKLLAEFGVPAVAGVISTALYNVVDSIFLGQAMGDIGLAATTVAMPLMTVLIALGVLGGAGGNALAAILLGEGKKDRAEQALGNAMFILIALAVPVAFFATFCLDPLLILVGASDVTLPYARSFMQIIAYGFMFSNISFGINNFIRTAGAPNLALGVSVLSTVVCIVFNWLFVLEFGWGVEGSALATVIGQASGSAVVLWYFILSKSAPFKLRAKNLKPDWKLCGRICAMGLAPFALQCAAAITQVVGNSTLATLGAADPIGKDGALASIGVVMKIVMFAVFPAIGIATAAQPILGFNVGSRQFDRVKRCLYDALATAAVILLIFFAIIHLVPEQLVGLFGVSQELTVFSIDALKVMTIFMPITAVQMIGSNYFQATGQPMKSAVLSLTRQIIFLLPMYFIAPAVVPALFPQFSNLFAFCFAFPVSDLLSVCLCAIFLFVEVRRLNKLVAQSQKEEA